MLLYVCLYQCVLQNLFVILQYVRQTLEDVIHSLIDNGGDCEVDTNRLSGKYSLSENQQRLCESCQTVWYKIFNSSRAFPVLVL